MVITSSAVIRLPPRRGSNPSGRSFVYRPGRERANIGTALRIVYRGLAVVVRRCNVRESSAGDGASANAVIVCGWRNLRDLQ
jgi:hypothetical protein